MLTSYDIGEAVGHLFREEIDELKRLVKSLPPNPVVVNIGAGAGTSALAFLEERTDIQLYTVDIEGGDSPTGGLKSESKAIRKAGYDLRGEILGTISGGNLGDDYTFAQICADSRKAGLTWGGKGVDLVFVDGDHAYDGCRGDIEAWIRHIKPGGIIAVDDYDKFSLTDNWRDVVEAVDDALVGKYEMIGLVKTLISFRIP